MKFLLYIFSVFLIATGLSTIILYINLFTFGYNFKEYMSFIIKLPEFYFIFLGVGILVYLNFKIRRKYERNIWYIN